MSTQYGDPIREVFKNHPASIRRTALRCIATGVFPVAALESAQVRWAMEQTRRALKEVDASGLPFAGKTAETDDDGAPVWAQRELWDYDTYALNIDQYTEQASTLQERALLLREECRSKFGRAPEVPGLDGESAIGGAA